MYHNIDSFTVSKLRFRDSAVVIVDWNTSEAMFDSWQGQDIFGFSRPPMSTPGPNRPPIQYVLVFLRGGKRSGREADHSPTSSVEVTNTLNYTFTPSIRLDGVLLN